MHHNYQLCPIRTLQVPLSLKTMPIITRIYVRVLDCQTAPVINLAYDPSNSAYRVELCQTSRSVPCVSAQKGEFLPLSLDELC